MPSARACIGRGYYRITHDKIDHVRSVYARRHTVYTKNVGTDYSLAPSCSSTCNCSSGGTSTSRPTCMTTGLPATSRPGHFGPQLQLERPVLERVPPADQTGCSSTFTSRARSIGPGRDEGHIMSSAAISSNSSTASSRSRCSSRLFVQASSSRRRGPDFYNHFRFERSAPMFTNLTWNFNNYRPDRRVNEATASRGRRPGEEF